MGVFGVEEGLEIARPQIIQDSFTQSPTVGWGDKGSAVSGEEWFDSYRRLVQSLVVYDLQNHGNPSKKQNLLENLFEEKQSLSRYLIVTLPKSAVPAEISDYYDLLSIFRYFWNYNMFNCTERQQLHQIKTRIEEFLIKPKRTPPSLLNLYNKMTGQTHCYRVKNNDENKVKGYKTGLGKGDGGSRSTSVKGLDKTLTPIQKDLSNRKDSKKNQPKHGSSQSKTPKKNRSVSLIKNPFESKKKKPQDNLVPPATRLQQFKKRYGELVSLALKSQPPKLSYLPDTAKQKDISKLKHQLHTELANYCTQVKTKKMSTKERNTILDYIEEIMNKYEFLLT